MGSRLIKQKIAQLLLNSVPEDFPAILAEVPHAKRIAPLFSFLCESDEILRWHAITALGQTVAAMADRDLEAGRVVMRRLMWHLNDESGGIGWGAPEAMGEIMARHPMLGGEFHHLLVSYVRPDGNFIEYPMLQRGVLWGIGRVAQAHSDWMRPAAELLPPYLKSTDPYCRGLAAWAAGLIDRPGMESFLKALASDDSIIKIYLDGRLILKKIMELARPSTPLTRNAIWPGK